MAVEDVFKLLCPKASRFDVAEINRYLKPLLEGVVEGSERAALFLMLTGAGNYSSASHQYRHAAGSVEPEPASVETAVLMMSVGTAILRWLIALDRAVQSEIGQAAAIP